MGLQHARYLALALTLLTGCASERIIKIDSNPRGARLEVEGVELCEATPCQISLECTDAFQMPVTLEALPTQSLVDGSGYETLYSDSKMILPCNVSNGARVRFDLTLKRNPPPIVPVLPLMTFY